MAIPYYMTAVVGLTHEVDELLNHFIQQCYATLAQYMAMPLSLALTLAVIVTGAGLLMGWWTVDIAAVSRQVLKWSAVVAIALHWSFFSHSVYALLVTASSELADVVLHAAPIPIPRFTGEGIDAGLQTLLIEFTKVGVWAWINGSWHNIGPYVNAVLIWGFGFCLLFYGLFQCILAKIMLALLLALTPLFSGFAIFTVTQPLFDRWLGVCVGFALLMVMISLVLALCLCLAEWAIGGIYQAKAVHLTLIGFIPVMMIGIIGIGIIHKTAQLAHHIAGSVSTLSSHAMLASFVGALLLSGLRRTHLTPGNESKYKQEYMDDLVPAFDASPTQTAAQATMAQRIRLWSGRSS